MRLMPFGRHAAERRRQRGEGKPETFTFFGLTQMGGTSGTGRSLLLRHTATTRLRAKLSAIRQECLERRHEPVVEQGKWLRAVVQGYFNNHGVPTYVRALGRFRDEVTIHWRRALARRSQRNGVP